MNWHHIPNSLVILLVAGFYGTVLLLGWPVDRIFHHTLAGVVALAALLVMHVTLGPVGLGVVKLCSAMVLIFGPDSGLTFFAVAFASCAFVGFAMQIIRQRNMDMPFLPFAGFATLVVVASNENWFRMIA